jgi:hypothetical protein
MVKATTMKPLKVHKAHRDPSIKEDSGSVDEDETSDMDEEAFADCLTRHEDDTKFDYLVDKCFLFCQEIGKTRKFTYMEKGVEVQKDVYNVKKKTSTSSLAKRQDRSHTQSFSRIPVTIREIPISKNTCVLLHPKDP